MGVCSMRRHLGEDRRRRLVGRVRDFVVRFSPVARHELIHAASARSVRHGPCAAGPSLFGAGRRGKRCVFRASLPTPTPPSPTPPRWVPWIGVGALGAGAQSGTPTSLTDSVPCARHATGIASRGFAHPGSPMAEPARLGGSSCSSTSAVFRRIRGRSRTRCAISSRSSSSTVALHEVSASFVLRTGKHLRRPGAVEAQRRELLMRGTAAGAAVNAQRRELLHAGHSVERCCGGDAAGAAVLRCGGS